MVSIGRREVSKMAPTPFAVLFLMPSSTPCTNPLFFEPFVCSLSLRHAAVASAQGVLCQVERSCFVLSEVAPSSGLNPFATSFALARSLARHAVFRASPPPHSSHSMCQPCPRAFEPCKCHRLLGRSVTLSRALAWMPYTRDKLL